MCNIRLISTDRDAQRRKVDRVSKKHQYILGWQLSILQVLCASHVHRWQSTSMLMAKAGQSCQLGLSADKSDRARWQLQCFSPTLALHQGDKQRSSDAAILLLTSQ
jgi:hypothetical protein